MTTLKYVFSRPPTRQSIWEEVSEQASAGPLPRQPDGPQLLRLPHGEDADEQAEQEPTKAALRQQQPEQGEEKKRPDAGLGLRSDSSL